ncbi:MAG: HEAT repeat domain-containing protein [Planctomycetota bacterium]
MNHLLVNPCGGWCGFGQRLMTLSPAGICVSVLVWLVLSRCCQPTYSEDLRWDDPDLDRHLRQLDSQDEMDQLSSAAELAGMGARAAPARKRLEQLLDNSNRILQLECLTALGAIGPLARESAPAVARFINSDAAFLQIAALDSLRQIGRVPTDQVPRIRVLVEAADPAISTAAARCLISAVDAPDAAAESLLQTLVKTLQQSRPDVRSESALGLMEAGPRVIPLVQPLLSSDRWPVRIEACRILAHFNADSVGAVPALQVLMHDRVDLVVRAAAEALGEIDGDAVGSLPLLAELLERDSMALRVTALRAMGRFGPQAAGHIHQLTPFLKAPSPMERIAAAEALQGIGGGHEDAIAALLPVLSDPHVHTAAHAAAALAAQGRQAVPSLLPLLQNDRLRNAVLEIFVEMGPAADAALPELLRGVSDGYRNPISRRLALRAIGAMGSHAAEAGPEVIALLRNPAQRELHPAAAWVLGRIGSSDAIPALQQAADSTDQRTQAAAAWALVMLHADDEVLKHKAVPLLLTACDNSLPFVRREALAALAVMGPDALAAVPALMRLATLDVDPVVRAAALHALAEIRPWNAPQRPIVNSDLAALMLTSLQDPAIQVREAACYLAGRMQGEAAAAEMLLRDGLQSGDERHRVLCAWALMQAVPQPASLKVALPWMQRAAEHPDPWIREEAAHALTAAAGNNPEARALLQKLQKDPVASVRSAASSPTHTPLSP